MQGFYQIAAFATPKDSENMESGNLVIVDYIIISRRSRDRAGLRYQRRGIDDDANVANFVETETIVRVEVSRVDVIKQDILFNFPQQTNFNNVFSHVQIRGSSRLNSIRPSASIHSFSKYLVPLFWTQSGYSLKPAPTLSLDRTHEQNIDTLNRHFTKTIGRYGPHVSHFTL